MSQWTYVRGCMELSCTPYETKFKEPQPFTWHQTLDDEQKEIWRNWVTKWRKGLYLPYPEEQFKITTPVVLERYRKPTKKNPSDTEKVLFCEECFVYSLPRAKKYLDEAFDLLPHGEVGFRYAIKQDCYDYTSSVIQTFEEPCLNKYYKAAIDKLYQNEGHWEQRTFEDLVKYQGLNEEVTTNNVNDMTIGIVESLRWCSADELQKGLEDFFQYLRDHDFEINNVLLEWTDCYEYHLLHRCSSDSRFDTLVFETINTENNQVIRRKTYYYPTDENGFIDYYSPEYDSKKPLVKEEVLGEAPVYPHEEDK